MIYTKNGNYGYIAAIQHWHFLSLRSLISTDKISLESCLYLGLPTRECF